VKASLASVRSSAEKWRNGLSALVTLVTTGVLLTGPSVTADLTTGWRSCLTALAGSGLAVAVYGLAQCLAVEAGAPGRITYDRIASTYGTLAAFDVHLAGEASDRLRRGRRAGVAALVLLGVAAMASWWAETKPEEPTPVVAVETGDDLVCGTLASADDGEVAVDVEGEKDPHVIPYDDIDNFRVDLACP
jgi:hypothetical protein